ncbi:MAG: hypothetical protein ACYDCL_00205 [Myxococcales bacterium]
MTDSPTDAVVGGPDAVFEASDVVFEASDVVFGASDVVFGASDVVFGASDVVFGASDVLFEASDVLVGGSDVVFEGSDVLVGGSDATHGASSTRFGRWCPVHGVLCVVLDAPDAVSKTLGLLSEGPTATKVPRSPVPGVSRLLRDALRPEAGALDTTGGGRFPNRVAGIATGRRPSRPCQFGTLALAQGLM